eukprot:CAMPEP_0181200132 /NCGR_PEP_ID=MMETSP1096-20121128/17584_1 /TAXON_ID=156174 ORGANISM="Chrysochromulina ericina, Strain CCMP281" /NCGR_SAMPLE_ID=MMETSP1096 /ASSEMBLY_ACC=CAM_ASM_000453 /LENGTH=68 /DNA_ID=CAMNT_0023290435 /DNA_START=105 /DNA_END=311 /DNA_ORIENTATION=+
MDEEPVDPKAGADAKCAATSKCTKLLLEYEACAKRIEKKGHGDCTGQFMDYTGCVDRCAAKELMGTLK